MTLLFITIIVALVLIGSPLFLIVGSATALSFFLFLPDHQTLLELLPVVQKMEDLITKQEFLAVPLFMMSGAIMTQGGIARRLVRVAMAAFGWMPGGLAVSAVVACMFFAAISGSSPVTLIAVGSIVLPAMTNAKYPENFSLGLITTAGSLGCLVPPSISMLIYAISTTGSVASVSPEDLFLAGLIPAAFVGGLLCIYSIWVGLTMTADRQSFNGQELRTSLVDGFWALLLPVIVLGGIYGGLYTPSEAGAPAAIYALFVTKFIYRELDFPKLRATLIDTAALMGSLLPIIALAFGLNEFLALIGIHDLLMQWIRDMNLGPFGFLLLVNVVLIVIGALMDSISCTLIFAPMLAPIAYQLYGIDPVHFGIVFVVNMEIGYLMPPVATNLFVSAAVFRKPFGQVVRAVLPTLGITCGALVVMMYVPTISKAALNWKRGVAIYEPFPWDGRPVGLTTDAPVTPDASGATPDPTNGAPGSGAANINDLMNKAMADFDEESEVAPSAAPSGTPTINDLMKKSLGTLDED